MPLALQALYDLRQGSFDFIARFLTAQFQLTLQSVRTLPGSEG